MRILLAARDHGAPGRDLGRHADAEEREPRFRQDGVGEDEGHLHQDRRHQVRQYVPPQNARGANAQRAHGFHEQQFAHHQRRCAHHPRHARRVDQHQRQHRVDERRPQDGHQRDGQQDVWEGHHRVHHAHQRRVEPAEKAGHQAQHRASDNRAERRERGDGQRVARAVHDARIHVAAEFVGAEQVLGAGRLQAFQHRGVVGVGGGEQRCADGHDGNHQQHQRGDHHDASVHQLAEHSWHLHDVLQTFTRGSTTAYSRSIEKLIST